MIKTNIDSRDTKSNSCEFSLSFCHSLQFDRWGQSIRLWTESSSVIKWNSSEQIALGRRLLLRVILIFRFWLVKIALAPKKSFTNFDFTLSKRNENTQKSHDLLINGSRSNVDVKLRWTQDWTLIIAKIFFLSIFHSQLQTHLIGDPLQLIHYSTHYDVSINFSYNCINSCKVCSKFLLLLFRSKSFRAPPLIASLYYKTLELMLVNF